MNGNSLSGVKHDHASRRADVRKLSLLSVLAFCLALVAPVGPLLAAVKDSACISCHEGPAYRETNQGGKEVVHFSRQELNDSTHKSLGCTECHTDASTVPHKKELGRVDCTGCHREASLQFEKGIHGVALKRGDKDAPSCT